MKPSSLQPDIELRDALKGQIRVGLRGGGTRVVTVYGDWERPSNGVDDDFLVVMLNGNMESLGMDIPFARGYIMVSLYSRLNDDGSVRKNRVQKILAQFDEAIECLNTSHYFYQYAAPQFITPTTPNITSGYSITTLNLKWNTNNNIK